MTADTASLYDEAIKIAARSRVGAGLLDSPQVQVTIDNPLCGDRITLGVTVHGGRVWEVGHKVRGCLLCEAAASVLSGIAPRVALDELEPALRDLRALLEGEVDTVQEPWKELDMFAPVREFKSRHRCATLPFEALSEVVSKLDPPTDD